MKTSRRDTLKLLGMAIATHSFPLNLYTGQQGMGPRNPKGIQSAFNPAAASWDIEWPGKVTQYDVVYLSPPIDPLQGIPLGNGDVGALIWCEESKIVIAVNKSDLWDDSASETFRNWKPEEEDRSTTLRHACRIVIDFKFPVFSTLYLADFKATLSLRDASVCLKAESPFGAISFEAFVDHESGLLLSDIKSDFLEDVPVEVVIERYGSRTFSHWYSQINRDAAIGTDGTTALADSDGVYLTQELPVGSFAVGAAIVQKEILTVSYNRLHSRSAGISLKDNKQKHAQLAVSVTSPVATDALTAVKLSLVDASKKAMDVYRAANEQKWKLIWSRSFLDYGDDYLNNLWYLTMYYANASQGGKYPGRFTNGLWGWNRDVQNWNFYFHWNQQQLYWPLNAAGYHELVDPYLNYRFNSLEYAKESAQKLFNTSGAFISDVTERRGYNSSGESHNHTPVAEIALDFWRQYRFTGDKKFLKEKALPFIIEAARFFESLFIKDSDGLYHAKAGTGYEGWILLKDGLTEMVYAQALMTTALEALEEAEVSIPESGRWKELLAKLAPMPVGTAGSNTVNATDAAYTLKRGYFKGQKVETDKIIAAGWGIKEQRMLFVYNPADDGPYFEHKLLDGIFPSVPSCPVFPSGVVSLSSTEKDKDFFETMKTTTLLYGPGITGWDPVPIVMARLGLTDALKKTLDLFPARWQIYCNGWGHWGPEEGIVKDYELFFRTNKVKDVSAMSANDKFPFPMWPFRHMSMESMSVMAAAMNESLLQSHEGFIRIAPSFPADRTARFTLHATGGFVVSAEILSGEVQWICIKSKLGNICSVMLPWQNAAAYIKSHKIRLSVNNGIAEFKTSAGDIIMLVPHDVKMKPWVMVDEKPAANANVKYHSSGKAQLGIPKQF